MHLSALRIAYTEFQPKAANTQRQDVYRSMYAFNHSMPVSQSTESLVDFLERASYTEFRENVTTSSVTDTASLQTDVGSE
jgi:hypothetical protein